MNFLEYDKLRPGNQVVLISTGEPMTVSRIYRTTGKVVVTGWRHGLGVVTQEFHYIELGKL